MSWPTHSMSELSEKIDYGHTESASAAEVGPRFLRITDIQNGHVDWSGVPYCRCSREDVAKYRLAPGDIVFARTGATTGKSFLIRECPKDAVFASYLIRVRPDLQRLDPGFLSYFFQTPQYWGAVVGAASGSTQPGVNSTKLKGLPIPLPPLDIQKRIAAVLDKADSIRRKRKQVIARLDELLQSVFLDMFGDPVTNPKGWEVRPFAESLRLKSGESIRNRTLSEQGPVPVYGGNGIIGYTTTPLVSEPTVILGRVGVYCGNSYHATGPCWVSDNALYVAENRDQFSLGFLNRLLTLLDLNQYKSQAGQPLISHGRLKDVALILPPAELQAAWDRATEKLAAVRSRNAKAIMASDDLFNSLLQRAFKGELDFNENNGP